MAYVEVSIRNDDTGKTYREDGFTMKTDLPDHILGDRSAAVEMDVTLSQPSQQGWLKVRVAVRLPCDPSSLALKYASDYAFNHALAFATEAVDAITSPPQPAAPTTATTKKKK
jgi:hypothetical protein